MTERSNGNKERDIDFVLYEETRCLGSRALNQTAPGAVIEPMKDKW
jgi:hypothetical protein